jgi:hypothetical protein
MAAVGRTAAALGTAKWNCPGLSPADAVSASSSEFGKLDRVSGRSGLQGGQPTAAAMRKRPATDRRRGPIASGTIANGAYSQISATAGSPLISVLSDRRSTRAECFLGAGLFAFSDALVEVDHRLFLVEFTLFACARVFRSLLVTSVRRGVGLSSVVTDVRCEILVRSRRRVRARAQASPGLQLLRRWS